MAASEDAFRHLLLDPDFWKPRLQRLTDEPQSLVRVPRTDLSRPGIEVIELRIKSHDGATIRALMAHSAFHRNGGAVHLRTCYDLETCALDWGAVEQGTSDVVFPYPPDRKLEDRVLDVLRLTAIVASMESVDSREVRFHSGCQAPPDEFVIADLVRDMGWA
jgi:hypothetical protein